jgi:hypothetical protein
MTEIDVFQAGLLAQTREAQTRSQFSVGALGEFAIYQQPEPLLKAQGLAIG